MSGAPKSKYWSPDHDYAHYFVIWRLTLDIFYLYTKFGDSPFSRYRDMMGDPQSSLDLTMPHSGVVCHSKTRTFLLSTYTYYTSSPYNSVHYTKCGKWGGLK